MTIRRRAVALTVAVGAVVSLGAAGCTDDGDKDAFCSRIRDTPALGDTLGALDASDPGGAQAQLEEAARQFRQLEADAPGAVKEDIARVRRGVDVILDAVEANPDDMSAARAAITSQQGELVGLASAAADVVSYVQEECGVTLEGMDPGAGAGAGGPASSTPTSDDATTTTEG